MALDPKLSFSSGELDPILHDRVTLEKYRQGLATARNVMIGKTGSILSRFSRTHFAKSKNNGQAIKLFSPPGTGFLLEWGHQYVRIHKPDLTYVDVSHALVESDLYNMHFTSTGKHVYVFVKGKEFLKLLYDDASPAFITATSATTIPSAPTAWTYAFTALGYNVDFLVTSVKNGEESLGAEFTANPLLKPINAGEYINLTITIDANPANLSKYTEIRVYQRPTNGGAYGYLGSSTKIYVGGGAVKADFTDLGASPDYTNGVQDLITKYGLNGKTIPNLKSRTGVVYQQRLLLTDETDEEAILASRPGYQNNFYRDFPYADDSALQFKSGTSGRANVYRMIDNEGIFVFTSIGVYVGSGPLGINNLALEKKSPSIIDPSIPPLVVPGGVFFVENLTGIIRQLSFSQEIQGYESLDKNIFSSHLFKKKGIKSWAYQTGVVPMIMVSFTDGTFATFTYNLEHQMNAWTRSDSKYPIEQIEGSGISDISYFVTNKNGNRYIEKTLSRYAPGSFVDLSPAPVLVNEYNAFMDAMKSESGSIIPVFTPDVLTLTPVTPNVWDGPLILNSGTSGSFSVGDVGKIFRYFDKDESIIDLEVTFFTNANNVTVMPNTEFPSDENIINPNLSKREGGKYLFRTFTTMTGLDHLEGESVTVLADGAVYASPNNDIDNHPTVTVTGGQIVFPDPVMFASVGRPITADIETLNISTVEQSPTILESLTVNKLYVKINETRGVYCQNEFPKNNKVKGMENLLEINANEEDIIGNVPESPVSKRVEKTIQGDWSNQGKMCFRQVDPYHFEILSIIPDVEVLSRGR